MVNHCTFIGISLLRVRSLPVAARKNNPLFLFFQVMEGSIKNIHK